MVMPLPSPSRIVNALFPTTPTGASSGAELVTTDGRQLPLVASTLKARAHGGIARLVLEQRFENKYDETLRVTYRMPLPADGAVSGYAFDIGERTVKGVVDKKARARERFETAIANGQTAALLEQERADIFTQQIGNIPPREAVVARITIDQRLAWLPEGEWELRFPTVIGPRYIGSADTAEDVRATHIKVTDQPLPVRVQIELVIDDAITGGKKASSPSHALKRCDDGVLELQPGARLDRDIVVRWPVASPAAGLSLAVARPADSTGASIDAFGLVTIVPPAADARVQPVARDLLVLLDTSGSMGGGPLDKAKQVVAMMIDSLAEHDRFELIEFSSRPSRYKAEPEVATAKAKQAAIKWVRSREADGGTEMRAAVMEALATLRIGAQRQVVVVTDGYVGGEQQILEVLHERLPRSCRLHVLGVGSAVNRSLATALARAGRGAEVIIGIDEDAERGAKRLLDRTRAPMLTNLDVSGSALVRHAPEHLPDVFAGAPLVAAVAVKPEGGELIVRGELATGTWEQRVRVPARQPGEGDQAICALYAREHVADLEARSMLESVNEEIEATGVRFQIATRFTSWVAIDEVRREITKTRDELVPQELPYGTRAQAFGLRAGGPLFARQAISDARTLAGSYRGDVEELALGSFAAYDDGAFAEEAPTGGGGIEAEASLSVASFEDADELTPPAPAPSFAPAPRSAPPLGAPSVVRSVSKPSAPAEASDAPPPPAQASRSRAEGAAAPKKDAAAPAGVRRKSTTLLGAAAPEDKKEAASRLVAPKSVAPAEPTPVAAAAPAPVEPGEPSVYPMLPESMPAPTQPILGQPKQYRPRLRLWMILAMLFALIALLLWWLVA